MVILFVQEIIYPKLQVGLFQTGKGERAVPNQGIPDSAASRGGNRERILTPAKVIAPQVKQQNRATTPGKTYIRGVP